jgi:hypothetical protein
MKTRSKLKQKRAKRGPYKPFLCKTCKESAPKEFYGEMKSICKACYNDRRSRTYADTDWEDAKYQERARVNNVVLLRAWVCDSSGPEWRKE